MQPSFEFTRNFLVEARQGLMKAYGRPPPPRRMDPVSQLVKSAISSRTKDAVSWSVFLDLRAAFCGDWSALSHADSTLLLALLTPVTFAEDKARNLPLMLRTLQHRRGGLELDFLSAMPVDDALAWLRTLPHVGCKTAASVLNFSRLNMPTLVVDTHVHRVTRRLGLSPRTGDVSGAYDRLMGQAPTSWTAEDFQELHDLVKRHGQLICTHAQPNCARCVLAAACPQIGAKGAQIDRL